MMNHSLYKRPNKPLKAVPTALTKARIEYALEQIGSLEPSLEKPKMETLILSVDKATECHVTPPDVAARMVEYLDVQLDTVLEPQAGTGNLVQALIDSGCSAEQITAIERHNGLCETIRARFKQLGHNINVLNQCFLEHSQDVNPADYTRVIMNSPFKTVKQHIEAGLSVLKEGGVLIALVPITYQHEHAVLLEELGTDVFASAKIRTKIIRIIK